MSEPDLINRSIRIGTNEITAQSKAMRKVNMGSDARSVKHKLKYFKRVIYAPIDDTHRVTNLPAKKSKFLLDSKGKSSK